jgi:hypothetical protein
LDNRLPKISASAAEVLTSKIFYTLELIVNNQEIRTLDKLRDTLLPKLISGEVRIQ